MLKLLTSVPLGDTQLGHLFRRLQVYTIPIWNGSQETFSCGLNLYSRIGRNKESGFLGTALR